MARMKSGELVSILDDERRAALAATTASKLSTQRERAMNFYLGDMSTELPASEDQSSAISTDVSDTVDGMMPDLMEIFFGGDEVVRFEPVGPEDVEAAKQETEYVNHEFVHKNPGFMVLYTFIKDALLSKVGVVKIGWDKSEEEKEETYEDQTDEQYMMLVSDDDVTVKEHTEELDKETGATFHDLVLIRKCTKERAVLYSVPPEEFGIHRDARSIRDASYVFHDLYKTRTTLLNDGFDPDQVENLISRPVYDNMESMTRDTVDERMGAAGDSQLNKFAQEVRITEHYIVMDYEDNDKPSMYRVTTGGETTEILRRKQDDGKYADDIVRWDSLPPFACACPVPVPHRFFGRSVADLVLDVQKINTVLMRGLLDNTYQRLYPRVEVSESHANVNTVEDILTWRPRGIIRTKQPGGIQWQEVPDISQSVFSTLQYVDARREWRTGVARQGQGVNPDALQNQVATIANQMWTSSQTKVRLIARILAETGVKDLFLILHDTIRRNGSVKQTIRLRNNWVTIDPRSWKTRDDMTVNVGLGSGGKAEQIGVLSQVLNVQKEMALGGLTNIVGPAQLYNAATDLARIAGRKDADRYFADPATQPPPQPKADPKMAEIQGKQQIELAQAQADIATQDRKTQGEYALAQQGAKLKEYLALLDAQIKREAHDREMQLKQLEYNARVQEIGLRQQTHQMDLAYKQQNHEVDLDHSRQEAAAKAAPVNDLKAAGEGVVGLADAIKASHSALMAAVTAPRKSSLIKDPKTNKTIGAVHTIEMKE